MWLINYTFSFFLLVWNIEIKMKSQFIIEKYVRTRAQTYCLERRNVGANVDALSLQMLVKCVRNIETWWFGAPHHEPSNNYYNNTHSMWYVIIMNSLHIIQIFLHTIYEINISYRKLSNYSDQCGAFTGKLYSTYDKI